MAKPSSSNSRISRLLNKVAPGRSKSHTSSNIPRENSGQSLDAAPNRSNVQDAPDAVGLDATHLLPPTNRAGEDQTSKSRTSHDSSRSLATTYRSQNEQLSTISSRRSAVRLPNQELTAASPGTTRLKVNEIFCSLIVSHIVRNPREEYPRDEYSRERVASIREAIVEYEHEGAFQELEKIATKKLVSRYKRPEGAFYLKVGRFRLVRDDPKIVVSRGILESQDNWDEYLPGRILEFLGQHRNSPFHLEIEWDYASLQIEKSPGQPYKETIVSAIEDRIRVNWQDRKFVPRKDLEKIMTEDTISKLIQEDDSLHGAKMLTANGGSKLDTKKFIKDISLWGARLLALCVYTDLELLCLYFMWLKGIKDNKLPLDKDQCPHPKYRTKFDWAVTLSGGFTAHAFSAKSKEELRHLELRADAVVPIVFDKKDPQCLLGRGSFGEVYKVHIDKDHHSFPEFEDEAFALKIFYNSSAQTPANVQNESSTLARLAQVPHDNITTHLASWNQDGTCYMLFRCADCNLRTYMKDNPFNGTKELELTILTQMRELADGLRTIHNLGPSQLEPVRVNVRAKKGAYRPSQTCYHHDLKPANILVFINHDSGKLLFSISDFGSAKIGEIRSGSLQPSPFTKNASEGDADYAAPDAKLIGQTSRPYDLWSMGCIYLEMLTWIVGPEGDSVKRFADNRMDRVDDAAGNQDQAFWYFSTVNEVKLKPAVVQQLKLLKELCEDRGVLLSLVHTVSKLLSIQPDHRPDASQLHNALDANTTQLEYELKTEDLQISNMPTRHTIAAPPSSVADSDDLSRRASIDERPHVPRFSDNLSPPPSSRRRSTVGSVHTSTGHAGPNDHTRHQSVPEAHASRPPLGALYTNNARQLSTPTDADDVLTTPKFSFSHYDQELARREAFLQMDRGHEDASLIGRNDVDFTAEI